MTPAERREAHRAWLEGLGLSAEDWRRIRLLASDVTQRGSPPALRDLSVPLTVAAFPARGPTSSKLLGTITQPGGLKVAVVCWPMSDYERDRHWVEARRQREAGG